ncbi:LysR substrate-binding domain-containing protein [Streptomyces griseofuscus]|uniref:LysR family transcriptional regulator n=1 Tax=Streptomyces griseofuscus TaxID=146922 RepID=A0A7H1QC07_9ACTN|nr:LysR family transcriptional regulator [Streptomyces griseofuscus]QNT97837.1 LysR family transcriptional regulator [Streptomyces griseofuscus]BBC98455.1 LysR family transcriptional regulator [Streptomyces rochei]
MELELRHLKTIRAIAEAGSLTRAATVLGLAQPALSAQLRRIERALGGALFERGRHGVRTTALGELVLERTRIVLPAVSELQREAARFARSQGEGEGERLRLGGTHGPLLGALVDRLADAAPGTAVTTCASWSERELAEMLKEGRLDFALSGTCGSAPPPDSPHLAWELIAVDPVFVMLADGHRLAHGREIELAALADEQWACVPGDGCFADCFTAACARAGFTPRRMYETDTASCVHLVQVGRAVGLCRATFPPTPGLAIRPLTGTPLMWRHLLGWHPAGQRSGTAATVLAQAREAHAGAAARSDSYAYWLAERRSTPAGGLAPVTAPAAGSIPPGQGVG